MGGIINPTIFSRGCVNILGYLKRLYKETRFKGSFQTNTNAENIGAKTPIPSTLDEIEKKLFDSIGKSPDFIVKKVPVDCGPTILIACMEELSDKDLMDRDIIKNIMEFHHDPHNEKDQFTVYLTNKLINVCPVRECLYYEDVVISILSGDVVLFLNGQSIALIVGIRKWERRSPTEPKTGTVLRGPREGFVESIAVNRSMLRRKIINPSLRFETFFIGEQTKTQVNLCYIDNISNAEIVNEVRKRILNIKTDVVLESAYIEQFIEDAPFSLFATVGNSERPDIVAAKILEGRVAILCDGTPFVLTLPHLFVEDLQVGDDYYARFSTSFIGKTIRIIGFILTLYLPGFYVSFTCFNPGSIPFKLLNTIYLEGSSIPSSVFVGCLFVIFLFTAIKETASLLPRPVAQSVSVVGGVVVGQALVMAGLVSIPTVIIVAITALMGYSIPELERSIRIIRLLILIGAEISGNFGITFISIIFFAHMCSIKSLGIPYLSPIVPLVSYDMKDVFFSFPVWAIFRKPETITKKYIERQRKGNGF